MFNVASFFKEINGGNVVGFGSGRYALFNDAMFSARSDRYAFSNFSFTAAGGATLAASLVPLPATLPLVVLAMLGLIGSRLRAAGHGLRRHCSGAENSEVFLLRARHRIQRH